MQIDKVITACHAYLQQTEEALTKKNLSEATAVAYESLADFYLYAAQVFARINQCDIRNMYYHKLAKLPWCDTMLLRLSSIVKELIPTDTTLCREILHTSARRAACELQVRKQMPLMSRGTDIGA